VQKLLVPIDFSEISQQVLELAASVAQAFSAELTLLHVAAPDPAFVGYGAGPETVREARASELRSEHRELQAAAEALRRRGVSTRALLVQGATVETILKEARKLGADGIVLGSHGRGALSRALLGSVSEGVLRASRCPVLVVPAARDED
jgi:nucleotide-binding universal stress UspA family protein